MKWILMAAMLAISVCAQAETETVEIQPQMFLAPLNGYDTTDQVQGVTHGLLTNSCYTAGEAVAERTGPNEFTVHQYATLRTGENCEDVVTPYTVPVKLGQLPQGSYQVKFVKANGQTGARQINVIHALTAGDHLYPYAGISKAAAKTPLHPEDHLVVNYAGTLNNGCAYMDKTLSVQREADVFILSPRILKRAGSMCSQVLIPFKESLDLGTVKPGYYLVHVRGMNGITLDRVVHVKTTL